MGNLGTIEDGTITINREHNLQNRLVKHESDTVNLTYDAVGNLTEDDQSNTYQYDAWNRLVAYNEADRYAYDALGRRTKEGTRTFLLDSSGNIAEEYESTDLLYQNIWSVDGPINTRLTYESNEVVATTWSLSDESGSSLAIYVRHDNEWDIERISYDQSGEITYLDETWVPLSLQKSSFGWNMGLMGDRRDSTANLNLSERGAISTRLSVQLQAAPQGTPPPPAPPPFFNPPGYYWEWGWVVDGVTGERILGWTLRPSPIIPPTNPGPTPVPPIPTNPEGPTLPPPKTPMQECLAHYDEEIEKAKTLKRESEYRSILYLFEHQQLVRPIMKEMNRRKVLRELIIAEDDYRKKIDNLIRQLERYRSMCTQPNFPNSKPMPSVTYPPIPQDMNNIA